MPILPAAANNNKIKKKLTEKTIHHSFLPTLNLLYMSVGSHFFTHSVRSLTSSSDALKSAISSTRKSHTNSPLNSISSVFHFYFFYIVLMQLLSALSLSNLLAQHFNPFFACDGDQRNQDLL